MKWANCSFPQDKAWWDSLVYLVHCMECVDFFLPCSASFWSLNKKWMVLYKKSCHKTAGFWGMWCINEKSKAFALYYEQSNTRQQEGFGKSHVTEHCCCRDWRLGGEMATPPPEQPHTWLWSVGEGLHVVRPASVGHHVNSHRDSWGDLLVVIWWHLHNKVILQGKKITFYCCWSQFYLLTSKERNGLINQHKPQGTGAMHTWDTALTAGTRMALSWRHLQTKSH